MSDVETISYLRNVFGGTSRSTLGRALVGTGLALVLAGCGGGASGSPATAADSNESGAEPAEGSSGDANEGGSSQSTSLPDFELETLDGETVRLSDHLGKNVVLIDFWATFCDPCLVAMPHLNELYNKYGDDGFVVLGVSIDGPESLSRVRSEVRKLNVDFPILLDPETEALALYNPKTSAPFSLLIDRKGNVVKKKEGFTPTDVPDLEKAIKAAL